MQNELRIVCEASIFDKHETYEAEIYIHLAWLSLSKNIL
jgi:hypothetical protein